MDKAELSQDRVQVLDKIEEFETLGGEAFFQDVENDPPSVPLGPDDVDYLYHKWSHKLKRFFAYQLGQFMRYKANKLYQIKVEGIENVKDIKGSAIITSNHFAHFESATVSKVCKMMNKHAKLFIVIREGNFTMPGIFGFLFRYCDTLPLSSNRRTMANFAGAVKETLEKGNFILIYPEQSMWWNYRKPRPQRTGAAHFACKNNVPLIPCFVTMKDGDALDDNGYPMQQYTIHVMKPLYKDESLSLKENEQRMTQLNYEMCKAKYEEIYGEQVKYACDNEQ